MTNIVENARRVRKRRREALREFERAVVEGSEDWFEVAEKLAVSFTGRRRERQPVSVIRYLVALGGVRDDGGDLRAMGCVRLRPGLVSSRGVTLDRAREALVEAGYLHESGPNEPATTTIDDVLELVREELSGRPHYAEMPPYDAPHRESSAA